jgi:hypothetical protein
MCLPTVQLGYHVGWRNFEKGMVKVGRVEAMPIRVGNPGL